jgi:hypothetical protein
MSWTQLDSIAPAAWPFTGRNVNTSINLFVDTVEDPSLSEPSVCLGPYVITSINRVDSMTYPGFDDGYAPCSAPNNINNNLNEGCEGGGGTRPTAGMLYPRGQG